MCRKTVHKIFDIKLLKKNETNNIRKLMVSSNSKSNDHIFMKILNCLLNRNKFISIIFRALVFTGLIWNLWSISSIYFGYQVTTQISIGMETIYNPVDLQFCARFTDIMSNEFVKNKLQGIKYEDETEAIRILQQNMNLNEIFQSTPNATDFFSTCYFRHRDSYLFFAKKNNECLKYFNVIKRFMMEYVCYEVSVRNERMNQTADLKHYAVSPVASGIPTHFFLTPTYNLANFTKISINKPGANPYAELAVAPQRAVYDRDLMVSPLSIKTNLLGHPYSDNCIDYKTIGFESSYTCYSECTENLTITRLGKLPYSILLNESTVSLQIVSYLDLLNETKASIVKNIDDTCRSLCKKTDCIEETILAKLLYSSNPVQMWKISILIPVDPSIVIAAAPKFTFTEYGILFLSAISTWTSISVLSLDPVKVINVTKKKKVLHPVHTWSSWRPHPDPYAYGRHH